MNPHTSKKFFPTSQGSPLPQGSSRQHGGVNFSLISKNATSVTLCLFAPENPLPVTEIPLSPSIHRTGDAWHILVLEIPEGYTYGYRVDGPYNPLKGHYFDSKRILIDPYAKALVSSSSWGILETSGEKKKSHSSYLPRAVISPEKEFDWEGDVFPRIPVEDTVIYEMHVRGFTQHSSSHVTHRGSFLGIIEKIPYLKSLGINAIELMPIHEFNEMELGRQHPETGTSLCNYWGYSTVNFFSPMNRYAEKGDGSSAIKEFKMLVKELHKNHIEVILDVVFNHTAEGDHRGPTLSFRGLDNSIYYMLSPSGEFLNFSGCGNTVNCNHPVVRELIRDCLRYWVVEMHVDGFRFDLASILTRASDGTPLPIPALIEALTLDPILAHTKLIAEAWDAGGLYQVGSFPFGEGWLEWNGLYRDVTRRFIKGTSGQVGDFATRLCGSQDLYGVDRTPCHSVNFVTAHDGFTLRDLVSYNEKHNLANGEGDRDGDNNNESWNCGEEGETDNSEVLVLRERQMRNFHFALMISQGVPMVFMGDEYGHTKEGNNNTWCHDNELNWFLWDKLSDNEGFLRFFRSMIQFRLKHRVLRHRDFLTERDIQWHGTQPDKPLWDSESRFIAFTLKGELNSERLYIAFNADHEPLLLALPKTAKGKHWHRIVDTSFNSPEDFVEEEGSQPVTSAKYPMPPHSAILLKEL